MVKFGKWVAKHRVIIVIICFLLMIPAAFGFIHTRINYDILSYLPSELETVQGQDIMVDEFGNGAFSMLIVEGMQNQDIVELEHKIENIDGVRDVLWIDDVVDITFPVEMFPDKLQKAFFNGDATMMVALFEETSSTDRTMEAVTEIRKLAAGECFVSGISSVVTDVKELAMSEMVIYVVIAGALCLVILGLTMESFILPILFLLSIGAAIIYNLGTSMFLGEISYITLALTAVLQLAVTMDYSIFLQNSYEENKLRFPGDKERAMGHAISNTFASVSGSSVTTVAGFLALCFMSYKLGFNIGIVMAKGVVIGVFCCIIFLPAMILICDGLIEKTKHRSLIPNMSKISGWITKYHIVFLIVFIVLIIPAVYGNHNVKVYYNISKSLPENLESHIANKKLEEKFDLNTMHIALLKNGMSASEKQILIEEMEKVDGVKWALGMDSLIGASVPQMMIPSEASSKLKSDNYEAIFVCTTLETATDEMNAQVDQLSQIVKKYSSESMVIGEAPLTKDLQEVTKVDFVNVNVLSIAAIFIIIAIVFKSISVPIILVVAIEFAIYVNMAISYFMGSELPFIASVVIGTIQLGATVDYAILMTSRYQKERCRGYNSKEAVAVAHKQSILSILISGLTFFVATFGVALYSKIDMIKSICLLLSRGAVISTIVVICIVPALLRIFDPIIVKTSYRFLH